MIIYQITNTVNGHFYIGKTTKTIQIRFNRHISSAKRGSNTYLHRAMRLHGFNNFVIEAIETNPRDLNESEKFYISTLSPHYNMTVGGDGGDTSHSPNFLLSLKNRKSNKGMTYEQIYGEETAVRLREQRTASNVSRGKRSKKTREKISQTRKIKIESGDIIPGKPPLHSHDILLERCKLMNSHHTCIHCGATSNKGNITRWHNNNCKSKK